MEMTIKYNHLKLLLIAIIPMIVLFSSPIHAKEPLLVIRIEGKDFEQALKGIRQEIGEEFLITDMVVTQNATVEQIASKMREITPKLVVLMDNIPISLYKKYQTASHDVPPVPSVSLMAAFADIAIEGMGNAAGIFYEVPLAASVMNLRIIMPDVKIRRVGVICRSNVTDRHIAVNQRYCRKEQIELVAYPIRATENIASELKKGLETLDGKERMDALWVSNDSVLLDAELLKEVWLPFAEKFRKPVIVGVEVLVRPKLNFGTFAVIPNHVELGVQAAEMISDIMRKNGQAGIFGVEQPRSVLTILNFEQANGRFGVGTERLYYVDKVLRSEMRQ